MHRVLSDPTRLQRAADAVAPTWIVVAEDDSDLRDMICEILRADGHDVQAVSDGRELTALVEATSLAGGVPPDLIISDVRMPGRTGLEALALLRRLLHRTVFVVITGFSDEVVLADARRCGAIGVLSKPFDLDDLRMIVSNVRLLA